MCSDLFRTIVNVTVATAECKPILSLLGNMEVFCLFALWFSFYMPLPCACMHAQSLKLCPTLCDPRVACQAPLSMGVGCHCLLQGIFPAQGSNLQLLHWQVGSLQLSHQGSLQLCCSSVALSCPTLCNPVDCSTPGFPVLHLSRSLLKFIFIESVMPSNHLILCWLLLLLPSILPKIRVFSNESALQIRWPKY